MSWMEFMMKRLIVAFVVVLAGSSWPALPKRIRLCRKGFRDRIRCSRLSTATPST